jgi:hypothetical protein
VTNQSIAIVVPAIVVSYPPSSRPEAVTTAFVHHLKAELINGIGFHYEHCIGEPDIAVNVRQLRRTDTLHHSAE